jgi:glycosyltransferase involved in cell wall biosynthesis
MARAEGRAVNEPVDRREHHVRILLIIDHLGSGGAQHQIVTLARGMAERGHEVSCCIYYPHLDHHKPALEAAGVRLYSLRKSSRFSLRVPLQLRRLMRKGEFQIALSYLTTPSIYNILASVGTETKTIVSERLSLTPEQYGAPARLKFRTYRLADRIVVNSGHIAAGLMQAYPWMDDKLVVIRNGVDLERFHPGSRPVRRAGDEIELLAIGSVHARKNFAGLVEALRVLRDRFGWTPSIRWAGRPPTSSIDVHALEQAEHLIDEYGLRAHWKWLGVRRDVAELMNDAAALIHPSFFEGLPNAICEAFASGLPVLAGRVCDNPWLIGDNERGLLFDPAEPADMARAIDQFSALDEESVELMGRRARRFAESELSIEKLLDRYESLFSELVEA